MLRNWRRYAQEGRKCSRRRVSIPCIGLPSALILHTDDKIGATGMIAMALCVGTIASYHSGIVSDRHRSLLGIVLMMFIAGWRYVYAASKTAIRIFLFAKKRTFPYSGGFMLVRYNNEDGSHGYVSLPSSKTSIVAPDAMLHQSEIDFRETMPAAGNETMYSR